MAPAASLHPTISLCTVATVGATHYSPPSEWSLPGRGHASLERVQEGRGHARSLGGLLHLLASRLYPVAPGRLNLVFLLQSTPLYGHHTPLRLYHYRFGLRRAKLRPPSTTTPAGFFVQQYRQIYLVPERILLPQPVASFHPFEPPSASATCNTNTVPTCSTQTLGKYSPWMLLARTTCATHVRASAAPAP